MSIAPFVTSDFSAPAIVRRLRMELRPLAADLHHWFQAEFSFWSGVSGEQLDAPGGAPRGDELLRAALARAVGEAPEPQIVSDEECVVLLALPVQLAGQEPVVALAAFATRPISAHEDLSGPAQLLGLDEEATVAWINRQAKWQVAPLLRLAEGFLAKTTAEARAERLQGEVDQVADQLSTTYEEISLLHGLTQNLRISSSDEELGRQALDWLLECLLAEGVAVLYLPVEQAGQATYKARTQAVLLTAGDCPLDADGFSEFIAAQRIESTRGPFVANAPITRSSGWEFGNVRQVIVTPLCEGSNLFGWLAAFNHRRDLEFGTVEASLLSSVGALLGIHSGNHELYRQQAEFLASVVRALTSAIDAKDPYTCGHSDRVARIAVRLAQYLGCENKTLATIYMAALLHDIGKIGIDDNVLRKPGRLTEAEFEHIKLHPGLGYKILADLKQLADALPVVLHHHEQWDGNGYPDKLAGENIPFSARIVAVADAYDAMSSDRHYRKGMANDKVDEIFRRGTGQQWDPRVIDAFFALRDEIRNICGRERANLTLDVQQWV